MRTVTGPGRTFSEQEAQLVLGRAAELQQEGGADNRRATLGELEAAAEEVGIDRALVRRAAAELRRDAPVELPARDNVWVGGPTALAFEAVVEGELGADSHEHVIVAIRRLLGETGRHDVLGRTLTWSSVPAAGGASARLVTVSVTSRDGITTIRVDEKLSMTIGVYFGGVLGGVGGGGVSLAMLPFFLIGMPGLVPVAAVAWFGGVYALCRKLYARKAASRRDELLRLRAALVAVVEERVGEH